MSSNQLVAKYEAPDASKTFSLDLPKSPDAEDVKAKTAYLSALRSNITQMQSDVNTFLTAKMEKQSSEAGTAGASKVTETKEEAMYGEEDPEADA